MRNIPIVFSSTKPNKKIKVRNVAWFSIKIIMWFVYRFGRWLQVVYRFGFQSVCALRAEWMFPAKINNSRQTFLTVSLSTIPGWLHFS